MSAPPEKSLLLQLEEHVAYGYRLIKEKKLTKGHFVFWTGRAKSILIQLLGVETEVIKDLDLYFKKIRETEPSVDQLKEKLKEIEQISEILRETAGLPLSLPISRPSRPPKTEYVFIIHGHDELNMRRLSDLLRDHFHLKPIVIIAKPGMSRPLIDKFEEDSKMCSFALALFTPDDHVETLKEEYDQARPNVIFETGWFVGRLGRHRVLILLKEGTEIHSDLDGVSRIQFIEDINEKALEIQRELQAAKII